MKALLITGGTGELGHAMLERLGRDYRCVVLYRSEESWQRLKKQFPTVEGVTDPTGEFYGVLHLAGGFTMGGSLDDFENMLEANLMSAVRAIQPQRIADGGRIVAISSAATLSKPAGLGAYVAAKSALNAYLEVLAKELQPRRITVNALLPSALDTPTMRKSMSRDQLVPLDRVTEMAAFLLSDAAASITGQLIAMTELGDLGVRP